MPIVDMPLEKLKVYQGRNPRPADFDEFWNKSLAELRAIDPAPVFEKHDLPAAHAERMCARTRRSVEHCPPHTRNERPRTCTDR